MDVVQPSVASSQTSLSVDTYDVDAVNSAQYRNLYKKREPIFPKRVRGRFRALKWGALIATLTVYYVLPWVRWARGPDEPDQAVLVDFAGRRFYFFFIEIWPDELYYVTGLLILAALGLFLATALFGRIWCGYACPQTVWTDLYIAVERLIEGDRNKRIKLANAPWSREKIAKKLTKHSAWLLIAAATGGAWIFYFHDAPTVFFQLFAGTAPSSAYIFLGLLTFTTYALAGTMREQVCTYMCPWPRIQAALTDANTLQVTYRQTRGEPRGAHKKGESWDDRGDCVDCRACVAACPMGIDIRDGAQLECINCALCIDACDDIMRKVDRPTGLIGYDTDENLERMARGESRRLNVVRPRTGLYAAVLMLVAAVLLYGLLNRQTFEVNLLRDRTPPFVLLSDGSVRNGYTLKIINKANHVRDFNVTVGGAEGLEISAIGETPVANGLTMSVRGDSVRSLRMFLTFQGDPNVAASLPLILSIVEVSTGEKTKNQSIFLTGAPG